MRKLEHVLIIIETNAKNGCQKKIDYFYFDLVRDLGTEICSTKIKGSEISRNSAIKHCRSGLD